MRGGKGHLFFFSFGGAVPVQQVRYVEGRKCVLDSFLSSGCTHVHSVVPRLVHRGEHATYSINASASRDALVLTALNMYALLLAHGRDPQSVRTAVTNPLNAPTQAYATERPASALVLRVLQAMHVKD